MRARAPPRRAPPEVARVSRRNLLYSSGVPLFASTTSLRRRGPRIELARGRLTETGALKLLDAAPVPSACSTAFSVSTPRLIPSVRGRLRLLVSEHDCLHLIFHGQLLLLEHHFF